MTGQGWEWLQKTGIFFATDAQISLAGLSFSSVAKPECIRFFLFFVTFLRASLSHDQNLKKLWDQEKPFLHLLSELLF